MAPMQAQLAFEPDDEFAPHGLSSPPRSREASNVRPARAVGRPERLGSEVECGQALRQPVPPLESMNLWLRSICEKQQTAETDLRRFTRLRQPSLGSSSTVIAIALAACQYTGKSNALTCFRKSKR